MSEYEMALFTTVPWLASARNIKGSQYRIAQAVRVTLALRCKRDDALSDDFANGFVLFANPKSGKCLVIRSSKDRGNLGIKGSVGFYEGKDFGLRRHGRQPHDKAASLPKLNIVTVYDPLRLLDGFLIVSTFDIFGIRKVTIARECADG
jgi:hypothetical protein